MIRQLNRIFCFLVLALTASSCWNDIDMPDSEASRPVLCANADIIAGNPFFIDLTHTWPANEPAPVDTVGLTRPLAVRDASVHVYFDGREVAAPSYSTGTMTVEGHRVEYDGYLCAAAPAPGTAVRIVADHPVYGHLEAETTVPLPAVTGPATGTVVYEPWASDPERYMNMRIDMRIPITSPKDREERYSFMQSWTVRNIETRDYSLYIGRLDYESDPIWCEHIDTYESLLGSGAGEFAVFTNRRFKGATYRMHAVYPDCQFENIHRLPLAEALSKVDLGLQLWTMSESAYGWALYGWFSDNSTAGSLGEIGLGDMLIPYSNTSTRAGIVRAHTPVQLDIDLGTFRIVKGKVGKNTDF